MILYLDSSALVKRYVQEVGSDHVARLLAKAELVATSVIARAEIGAAVAKAVRLRVIAEAEGLALMKQFSSEWPSLIRLQANEALMAHAAELAWSLALRGYGAVHLASALAWADMLSALVVVGTYDRALWSAAGEVGLERWPDEVGPA